MKISFTTKAEELVDIGSIVEGKAVDYTATFMPKPAQGTLAAKKKAKDEAGCIRGCSSEIFPTGSVRNTSLYLPAPPCRLE